MVPYQLNPFVTLSAKLGFIRKELLELLSHTAKLLHRLIANPKAQSQQ